MKSDGLVRHPDFGPGCLFLFIGVATCALARGYERGTALRMGPGYVPLVLGVLLGLCGLLALGRACLAVWRRRSRGGRSVGARNDVANTGVDAAADAALPAPSLLRPVLLVLASTVLFALLLRPLGLLIAIPALVLTSAAASRNSRPLPVLVLAVGLTAFAALVFVKGLGVALPLLPG